MVNWKAIDIRKVSDYCKEFYQRYDEYPSIRHIFYRFVDEFWPNTKSVYKRLSVWLRDKRLKGEIDWHLLRDGAGREHEKGDWTYRTPRRHILLWLDLFTQIAERYLLPRWDNQPKKVIVVCEKEADYPIIQSVTKDLNVDTAYARGYSGWRLLFEIAERFKEEKKEELVIIALSDFDPSGGEKAERGGKDLVSFLLKAMLRLGIENVSVEKVLVTKEQIEEFKLPYRPEDTEEIAKLRKDPRFKSWPYGLYRVETVALSSRQPDYFDKTIQDAVKKHFDEKIYQEIRAEEERLQKKVGDFFEGHEDLIEELKQAIEEDEILEP